LTFLTRAPGVIVHIIPEKTFLSSYFCQIYFTIQSIPHISSQPTFVFCFTPTCTLYFMKVSCQWYLVLTLRKACCHCIMFAISTGEDLLQVDTVAFWLIWR